MKIRMRAGWQDSKAGGEIQRFGGKLERAQAPALRRRGAFQSGIPDVNGVVAASHQFARDAVRDVRTGGVGDRPGRACGLQQRGEERHQSDAPHGYLILSITSPRPSPSVGSSTNSTPQTYETAPSLSC